MIDIIPDVIAALRSPAGTEAIRDGVRSLIVEELDAVPAKHDEKLQPLGKIISILADAARQRITRDDAALAPTTPASTGFVSCLQTRSPSVEVLRETCSPR